MKAAVITHSSTFNERAEAVARYLEDNGYTAVRIFADFDHRTKQTICPGDADEFRRYLHMKPYRSNLSVSRLLHIRRFAMDVGKELEMEQAKEPWDLLYFLLPANTFAEVGAAFKEKYGCKLVFDIIDLWPESLPLKRISWLPPVRKWAALRDRHLKQADVIFTECAMYQDRLHLKDRTGFGRIQTLYWFKEKAASGGENPSELQKEKRFPTEDKQESRTKSGVESGAISEKIHLLYLGAINHIIDINGIVAVLKALNRVQPILLDVIGDGENRETFLSAVAAAGVSVKWHGTVFDEAKKEEIIRGCTAGINMMKPGVQAGLSMKSIDYMENGLLLINNLPGDIRDLTETRSLGWNVPHDFAARAETEQQAMAGEFLEQCKQIDRDRIHAVYEELFTVEAFRHALECGFREKDGKFA